MGWSPQCSELLSYSVIPYTSITQHWLTVSLAEHYPVASSLVYQVDIVSSTFVLLRLVKGCRYLIEDLVTGGDLSSYIAQEGGRLQEQDARQKIFQILKALEYLHDECIVHRDLKPENVLLSVPSVGARVILTDFGGASGALKTKVTRLRSLCGTTGYVAP